MRSLIVGASGQDGVPLAQFLGRRGHQVHALVRSSTASRTLQFVAPSSRVHSGDATNPEFLKGLIEAVKPDEIYNLAAVSSVADSWKNPESVLGINTSVVLQLLEILKNQDVQGHRSKLYQASSSEMFGRANESPQTETTSFNPMSPYAVSKTASHQLAHLYREAYGVFVACGILYNHESYLRPRQFVTRKITSAAAAIKLGKCRDVELGTLNVSRDWGYAGDYVEAMWKMLQEDQPQDYVIATGISRPLREFVRVAFEVAGIYDWEDRIKINNSLGRPAEITALVGDASKALRRLNWRPTKSFETMIEEMVTHDLRLGEET